MSTRQKSVEGQLSKTPVAIIGMASIMPQAENLEGYWENILQKIDCVIDVPASRWNPDEYYDPDPNVPDKTYCKRGGFIPDVDFDPMEFGLPPNILEVTDVSQLLGLVVARDALEDAGYGEGHDFMRQNAGVILGVVGMSTKLFTPLMARLQYPVWEKVLKSAGVSDEDTQKIIEKIKLAYVGWEENAFPGTIGNVIAGRIANRFNLGGTNCVIDAACGSSLAAVRMALSELTTHRADLMITGGVDTDNSIGTYLCFSKTPAFTRGDKVQTFDAESSGMMVGEGLGMLVLKRLADAERDGDRIYAVIRGAGSSSDGRFKSIYAPRPSGQAMALRRAYEEAGYAPQTVGLIEAHGTGTSAGDPAEFEGLREVFGENNPRKQHIAIGSVKSQVAHTKATAGAASLIKTALALHHKILPPTINVEKPNPKLDVENSPFYINTETRPWIQPDPNIKRRAGVSSFGFGGTNFHVALEEYSPEHDSAYRVNHVPQQVLLSADTPEALLAKSRETLQSLKGDGSRNFFNQLGEESRMAEVPTANARLGFVAADASEAVELLETALPLLKDRGQEESWEHPKGIYYRKSGMDVSGKVVAMFSGQGSQYVEMGRELALNFPPVREVFSAVDGLFLADGLEPLSSRVYPRPVFSKEERDRLGEDLTRTEHAQPAIGAMGVSLYKLLEQAGFQADFTAGHSFGEWTALWAAGVLSDEDYFGLAKARGKAMSPPDDPNFDAGTMLAVKGDADKIEAELKDFPEITLANYNARNQVVLAGAKADIARVQQALSDKGYSVIPLPVSAAFHTSLVGHAQKPFAKAINAATFNEPKVNVYANSTGQAHSQDPKEIKKTMAGHILNPVRWTSEIEAIYAAGGRVFVEFGPKSVLTNLVKNILDGQPHVAVALNANAKKDSDRQLREAVVQLRVAGLNLTGFDPYQAPRVEKARKKSPLSMKLNGGMYITEKTRKAFQDALNDGFKIRQAVSAAAPVQAPAPVPLQPAATAVQAEPAPVQVQPQARPAAPAANGAAQRGLEQFQAHQADTARVHTQYLRGEEEYARTFTNLMQSGLNLLSNGNLAPGQMEQLVSVLQGLQSSMQQFHNHQAETLRVHEHYLKSQEAFSNSFARILDQQAGHTNGGGNGYREASAPAQPVVQQPAPIHISAPQPVKPANGNGGLAAAPAAQAAPKPEAQAAPAPVVVAPAALAPAAVAEAASDLTGAFLEIVSEKTGYPSEMLELDMDMEADLGIDSIKRVEILGAVREQNPNLPKTDPEVFAELRTLRQVIDYVNQALGAHPAAAQAFAAAPAQTASQEVAPQAAPAVSAPAPSGDLKDAFVNVVSEKTGYPTEMLELDMDMEADLGIDSIKRVEILGAVRELYPDLPRLEAEELVELRTLGEIVDRYSGLWAEAKGTADVEEAQAPHQHALPHNEAPAPTASSSAAGMTQSLLQVVSEKTGYPEEMLELDMDMEADLGIDSIKRVEILGAMREHYPDLPKVEPDTFNELRTLGQIVAHLEGAAPRPFEPAAVVAASMPAASAEEMQQAGIQRGVVTLKALPEPDFLEMRLPAGHVSLVTDDGTRHTTRLVTRMLEQGLNPVVLRFPKEAQPVQADLPEGVLAVTVADAGEPALEAALSQVVQQAGPVAIFVHLDPPGSAQIQAGVGFSEQEKAVVKQVFLLAKHLKDGLNRAAKQGRSAFVTVTRLDGAFGLGNKAEFNPLSGGLFGLVKSLNLEWVGVFCRGIDLSPELEADRAAQNIMAELSDPNRLVTEVAYSPQGRWTLDVEPAHALEVTR